MSDLNPYEEGLALELARAQGRIKELEAELATCEKYRDAYAECDRIGTQAVRDLEAKLTRAEIVNGLLTVVAILRDPNDGRFPEAVDLAERFSTALAELKGENDE